MIKLYPHSDSAEYKMWGNGVALPNVCFVLSGIVWFTQLGGEMIDPREVADAIRY